VELQQEYFRTFVLGPIKLLIFFFTGVFYLPHFINIITWDQLLGIMVVGRRNPFL